MIPYEDLVAALERWRARNGLPVFNPALAAAPSAAPVARPSVPPGPRLATRAAPAPAPVAPPPAAPGRSTMFGVPPAPAPRAPSALPIDDADLDALDVLEEAAVDDNLAASGGYPSAQAY